MAKIFIGNVYPTHQYLMERCAPAGFGLGGNGELVEISSISDIDSLSNNGWYAIHSGSEIHVAGLSFNSCLLEISSLTENHGWHIIRFLGKTSTLIRYKNNGVWGEWEWENPPMEVGVEYRTTERWQGKPVYTKLFDFGASADGASIAHELNPNTIVRYSAVAGSIPLPHFNSVEPEYQITVSVGTTNITMACGEGRTGLQTYVQVWYIKV